MSQSEVYFKNHNKALYFPWSIYHKPLLNNLNEFLQSHVKSGTKVLVIGPGDFQEFELLYNTGAEISILDIDQRVLKKNHDKYGKKIKNTYLVDSELNGYPDRESFDLIYAKEVIEHLVDYDSFLERIFTVLRPNGKLWLSTPNYGFFLLPLLESTILEIIAHITGFSRKNIHPSKFNTELLLRALRKSGYVQTNISVTFMKLAITASAEKPKL